MPLCLLLLCSYPNGVVKKWFHHTWPSILCTVQIVSNATKLGLALDVPLLEKLLAQVGGEGRSTGQQEASLS